MVSQARAINDSLFEANLLLDDRNELLDDHIAGQHVPGLVLVEAARQVAFLITAQFFIEPARCEQTVFVLNELNTTFLSFVFPLDIIIRYEILEKNLENPTKLCFSVLVNFLQAGRHVAEIRSKFTVSDKDRLTSIESTLARRALQQSRAMVQDEAEHQKEPEVRVDSLLQQTPL